MSVRNVYKNIPVSNTTTVFINEYLMRERLAKLGIQSDFESLDVVTADALTLIGNTFLECQQKELKEKRRGK